MGTKNCPETPRQKMINMMYLVLTAMLALNVAAETLQAFKVVDSSLMQTFKSFSLKNEAVVREFDMAAEENPGKVGQWRDLARAVHLKSDSLIRYIIETKEMLALGVGSQKHEGGELPDEFPFIVGVNNDTLILERQDDLNITPEVMMTKGRGAELQSRIIAYREDLINMVGNFPGITTNLRNSLGVDDPEKGEKNTNNYRTWVQQNFEASPCIASIAILSKLQIDVRNAESAVLSHLYNQIDAASFKFTGLEAKVIPNTNYVLQGQKYEAKIFLSAIDNTQELNVYMNGSNNALPVVGGEAIYSITPNAPGFFNYKGEIRFTNPDGTPGSRMFTGEYQVAVPAVTISPTKMNVLYRGLPNPISISVPGVPSEKLEVTFTNGKLSKVDNGWVVEPAELDPRGEKTKIVVKANIDGAVRNMGEMIYRVKKVPDPKATVAQMASGGIAREKLRVQQGVFAQLEDFDFDLEFVVTSFDMSVPSSGGLTTTLRSNSYKFTEEQKRLINGLGAGDRIYFENIKARINGDPKDPERILSPVNLTVQ